MFRRQLSRADTQLQRRKVVPFCCCGKVLFFGEKNFRLRIIFTGEKTFSLSSPKAVSPSSFLDVLCLTFDCKVTKDNSDPTAVRLDVCRDGVCTFRLSSVDRNCHTLCSKSPRDRLSQTDAATRDQRTLPLQSQIHSGNLQ